MTPEMVVTLGQRALEITLLLITVMLVPALIVGLLVSMFQAATQINEVTLSFIPKLLVTVAVIMFAGPWMLRVLIQYARGLIESIPGLIA
ncbi:MAG TPA: flagellar biosynthesis protein FliQ [Gammaproteobacteria bacterium]|nr:flagellar biosynthesis protein FliQ [Gammaproteobacteria bacterium]